MAEPAEATRMVVDEGKAVDSPMEAQVQKLAEKVWSEFFPASCLQASLKQAQLSKIVLCLQSNSNILAMCQKSTNPWTTLSDT